VSDNPLEPLEHALDDPAESYDELRTPLRAYRVMATIVGVLLVVLVLVGLPLHYGYLVSGADFLAKPAIEGDASTAGAGWRLGSDISGYLGVAHGWLYMIFLLTGLLLARKARWPLGFTIVTLLCGTIPLLSFWSEHRATRLTRRGAVPAR
jgi:integral membrane protein